MWSCGWLVELLLLRRGECEVSDWCQFHFWLLMIPGLRSKSL